MSSRSLDDLHPAIRDKAVKHILACAQEGIELLVYCTYRSPAEQEFLYAKGRTAPGPNVSASKPMGDIVTNARGGQSRHNHEEGGLPAALAYDAVPVVAGKAQWADRAAIDRVGQIGEQCGLSWAGRWKGKLKETVHFEVAL